MAGRALRSRAVEASQENLELPDWESADDRPSDQPEGLGSVGKPGELTSPSLQLVVLETDSEVLPSEQVEAREQSTNGPSFEYSG
jgi:hypothetical protein